MMVAPTTAGQPASHRVDCVKSVYAEGEWINLVAHWTTNRSDQLALFNYHFSSDFTIISILLYFGCLLIYGHRGDNEVTRGLFSLSK